jgi:hypothetical protein
VSDLYHYTCSHHAAGIEVAGKVVPGFMLTNNPDLPWTGRVAWFTNMATPHRDALGLTSVLLDCDRTEVRFRVTDPTEVVAWWHYARHLRREDREWLETQPGSRPAHWWVSVCGVPVVRDDRERVA